VSLTSAVYKELVFGGHLLALGTASMAATATFVLGKNPSWDLLLMAYLFSLGAYTINRFSDFEEDKISHPGRTSYLDGRRKYMAWISAACFLLGYALALTRNLIFFGALLLPLLLAVSYSFGSDRLKGIIGMSRLKEGLLVKNIAISFGWSLIPILVGLYYLELPTAIIAIAPFIFLRIMVNTIFFDQRDIEADKAFGVMTLPVRMGMAGSSKVMNVLDFASGAYIIGVAIAGVVPVFAATLAVFTIYSFAYRHYAETGKHKDSARDLVADGEYILWGIVTYIGHI
jgi:4-hydroxybenzoate polyprenyltransferase